MTNPDTVHDSPTEWVAEHIREYVETGGAQGQFWRGVPTLLLTTTGRKTGARRRTALIYGQLGDSYVVVASQGGAPKHPSWYLNLSEHPDVEVQVGPDIFSAIARTATEDERSTLWPTMAAIWPAYEDYQTKTSRQIPIVVLDPVKDAG